MMITKYIKFAFVGLFSFFFLVSCVKENNPDQYTPCIDSLDPDGFVVNWVDTFPEFDSQTLIYNVHAPIIVDDYIVYQRPSVGGEVFLTKSQISDGTVVLEKEIDLLHSDEMVNFGDKIYYVSETELMMINLQDFSEESIYTFTGVNFYKLNSISSVDEDHIIVTESFFIETTTDITQRVYKLNVSTNEITNLYDSSNDEDDEYFVIEDVNYLIDDSGDEMIFFYSEAHYPVSHDEWKILVAYSITDQKEKYTISLLPEEEPLFKEIMIVDKQLMIRYNRYNNGLVFNFVNVLANYNPNTGELLWEIEEEESFSFTVPNKDQVFLLVESSGQNSRDILKEIDLNNGNEISSFQDRDYYLGKNQYLGVSDREYFYFNHVGSFLFSINLDTKCQTRKLSSNNDDFNNLAIDQTRNTLFLYSGFRLLSLDIK